MAIAPSLRLAAADLAWLRQQANSAVAPQRLAERCRILLRAAEGQTNEEIAHALGITRQKAAR